MTSGARALEHRLMFEPGVAEWHQGYAAGWEAGRAELMTQLAQRRDCSDATWQTVPRPTWDEQVAERIAEMQVGAAKFRAQHGLNPDDWVGIGERAARLAVPHRPHLVVMPTESTA